MLCKSGKLMKYTFKSTPLAVTSKGCEQLLSRKMESKYLAMLSCVNYSCETRLLWLHRFLLASQYESIKDKANDRHSPRKHTWKLTLTRSLFLKKDFFSAFFDEVILIVLFFIEVDRFKCKNTEQNVRSWIFSIRYSWTFLCRLL